MNGIPTNQPVEPTTYKVVIRPTKMMYKTKQTVRQWDILGQSLWMFSHQLISSLDDNTEFTTKNTGYKPIRSASGVSENRAKMSGNKDNW